MAPPPPLRLALLACRALSTAGGCSDDDAPRPATPTVASKRAFEIIEANDYTAAAGTDADQEPLFRSAQAYIRMWEKAERRAAEFGARGSVVP